VADVEDGEEAGVGQSGEQLGLGHEPAESDAVARRPVPLDGDLALQPKIMCDVHVGGPAPAELPAQPVTTVEYSRLRPHGSRIPVAIRWKPPSRG
jgi:hypothetical protein